MIVEAKWSIKIQSRNWWASGLSRGARMKRARVGKDERQNAKVLALALLKRKRPLAPIVVSLTRISPGTLDDDNLAGGFKHIRDGISDALGIDDCPASGIEWQYWQEKVKGEYAMSIAIAW